jgi:hypothetical protein
LTKLDEEIGDLKDEISAYKAKVPVHEVAHLNYLTSLNTRLAGLEARRRRLQAQVSVTSPVQQGQLFHSFLPLLFFLTNCCNF